MLGAVPDFTVQLFEESLAALAVLFVVPNHLQVPLGGNVELVFDLLDVYVVIALDGLATCRSLLACFSGGLRVADVPLASLRALALLSPSPPPLGAELLLGVLGQVTPRLTILGSPRPTLLGVPLFLSPLLQTLLAFDFVALVAAVFLVLLDQELRFAGRPVSGLATLVRGPYLLLDPLPKLGVRVLLFSLRRLYVSTELPLRCLTGNWTCDTGDSRTPVR